MLQITACILHIWLNKPGADLSLAGLLLITIKKVIFKTKNWVILAEKLVFLR